MTGEGRSSTACTADKAMSPSGWKQHEGPCPTALDAGCRHITGELSCLSLGSACPCACHHGYFQWPTDDASGAICPIPESGLCDGPAPCADCCSIGQPLPLEPYELEDEASGSPIFLPGDAA